MSLGALVNGTGPLGPSKVVLLPWGALFEIAGKARRLGDRSPQHRRIAQADRPQPLHQGPHRVVRRPEARRDRRQRGRAAAASGPEVEIAERAQATNSLPLLAALPSWRLPRCREDSEADRPPPVRPVLSSWPWPRTRETLGPFAGTIEPRYKCRSRLPRLRPHGGALRRCRRRPSARARSSPPSIPPCRRSRCAAPRPRSPTPRPSSPMPRPRRPASGPRPAQHHAAGPVRSQPAQPRDRRRPT